MSELESRAREDRAERARDGDQRQLRINKLEEEKERLQVRKRELEKAPLFDRGEVRT